MVCQEDARPETRFLTQRRKQMPVLVLDEVFVKCTKCGKVLPPTDTFHWQLHDGDGGKEPYCFPCFAHKLTKRDEVWSWSNKGRKNEV